MLAARISFARRHAWNPQRVLGFLGADPAAIRGIMKIMNFLMATIVISWFGPSSRWFARLDPQADKLSKLSHSPAMVVNEFMLPISLRSMEQSSK